MHSDQTKKMCSIYFCPRKLGITKCHLSPTLRQPPTLMQLKDAPAALPSLKSMLLYLHQSA